MNIFGWVYFIFYLFFFISYVYNFDITIILILLLYVIQLYVIQYETRKKKWQHNLDILTYRCGKQDKDSLE